MMKNYSQISAILYRVVKVLFFAIFLFVAELLFFAHPWLNYVVKKTFLLPNVVLLPLTLLLFYGVYRLSLVLRRKNWKIWGMNPDHIVLLGSVVLLFVQLFISYHIYFATGWDAGGYVLPTARMIASGESVASMNFYFARYPNNILMVWLFSLIMRLKDIIPWLARFNDLSLIILLNCLISSLTGFLTYKAVKKLLCSSWAVFSWGIYVLLVGLSPWFVITYSDSLALFLPVLIFLVYTQKWNEKWAAPKWLLIGLLSFLGYYIRPQTLIMLIAILIIEGWKMLFDSGKEKRKFLIKLGAVILAFLLAKSANQIVTGRTGLIMNDDEVFGWSHFAMMGLNEDRDGVYSDEDVQFSQSFKTKEERQAANLAEIKARLKEMGPGRYLLFLARKTLVNYGDGTFAWGVEGNFFWEIFENEDPHISPWLRSYFYTDGENYGITSTVQNGLWVTLIFSMLGLVFLDPQKIDSNIYVLMLALIGLTLFETIFESRARYLFIYAPIYIILGTMGLKMLWAKFPKLHKSGEGQLPGTSDKDVSEGKEK